MTPHYSIDYCPRCGAGLLGIRICGLGTDEPHGLVVCDECESIWLEPDVTTPHQYPDASDARCPKCTDPLWGPQSRWATREDLVQLGWQDRVDPELNGEPDDHIA
ncbi:hypothetical protein [Rosistilla oblonga]|uniref:hypothetical protein n=1 Tax=Rosistilla oblonga TaxID=2527990 RepID=UPI003A985072